MRIYLVRHGRAADKGYDLDEDRPLTIEGRRQIRAAARVWAERGEPLPQRFLVSPLVRAVQTCEILSTVLGSEAPVEVTRDLIPDGRVSAAARLVDDAAGETLALVGHQPLIGALAAFLLGLRSVPAGVQPGAVLALDLPEAGGAARLAWHLAPAIDERGPLLLVPSVE